jgi:hypothetical protein
VVLTIPKRLRACCLYRRRLLGEIARVSARTVAAAVRTRTGGLPFELSVAVYLAGEGGIA